MDVLIVQPLGVAARHTQQPCHRGLCDLRQAGCGADTTAFIQMVNHIDGFFFRYFGVEEGGATSFGKLFATGATAQQAHAIAAIYFTDNKVVLATLTKLWAFHIDTG